MSVSAEEAHSASASGQDSAAIVGSVSVKPLRDNQQEGATHSLPGRATQLEEIVVTATKREQSVREIAGTVNALHGEDLEKTGARELSDFIGQVPGITLQEGEFGYNRKLAIRGVGPGEGGNQTTGQFIGDVPLTDPGQALVLPDLDPFDLSTFEVLRGPQGTTFGATALNGAIRYVPNQPELGLWQGRGFIDYTTIDQGGIGWTYGAALNAPIGDSLALRASGVLQKAPGVVDNRRREIEDSDSRDKWQGRLMAKWEPVDRFEFNALYLSQRSELNDISISDNLDGRRENNNRPGPSQIDTEFDLASIDTRYSFDWSTLVFQASRSTKALDLSLDTSQTANALARLGVENMRAAVLADIESDTFELRLVSPNGGEWSWIGGVFLQNYESDQASDQYVANTASLGPILSLIPGIEGLVSPNGITLGYSRAAPLRTEEKAVFGELSRRFGDRLEVTLGGRYYSTALDAEVENSGATILLYYQQSRVDRSYNQIEKGFSPKLSGSFAVTDDVLLYAAVARGFQFGGVNTYVAISPNDYIPPTYKSSTLWSYEAGVRSDWLDRTLRLDLTAFFIDWTDAQLQLSTPTLIETPYFDNVGSVYSKGLEGTVAWLTPVPGLSLNIAASYTVAETAAPYENGSQVVETGVALGAAPRVQTAANVAYSQVLGPWLASGALSHTYTGRAYNNVFHDYEIYDYQQLGLNFSVSRPDLRFLPTLTLGVSNLTDVDAFVGRGGTPGTAGLTGPNVVYNRPRTISLRVTAEF